MFYGARKSIFLKAIELRNNPTQAEKALWKDLNNKDLFGFRFKRQHPIDIFIADFYCHKYKLVIEVDGEIHNNPDNKEYDVGRESEMSEYGIKFSDSQIEKFLKTLIL
jgi:very-short-patch-repair endonuclease